MDSSGVASVLHQIEQVADRIQWIVNLVRQGCGKPAGYGELFRGEQRGL